MSLSNENNRVQWAIHLMQTGLDCPLEWNELNEETQAIWLRAADVLIGEKTRLIVIEDTLRSLNDALAPWTSIDELMGWAEMSMKAHQDLDAYLRTIYFDLPKYYGWPTDGVRLTIEALIRGKAKGFKL